MTTENQEASQDLPKRQTRRFAEASLALTIIVALIVPLFFAIKITTEFEKIFWEFDIELPVITMILIQAFNTVMMYRYLFYLLVAISVPLVFWLLTKLSRRVLLLLLVSVIVIDNLCAIILFVVLCRPLIRLISVI
jgi:type II secretory pathway component PulF